MTHQEHYAVFKVKHWGKPDAQLDWALGDCYAALNCHKDKPVSDPYVVKLWAEIDVIRDLFLLRTKKAKVIPLVKRSLAELDTVIDEIADRNPVAYAELIGMVESLVNKVKA